MNIDVLLSGFEPFDGAPLNESWEAVSRAVPELEGAGISTRSVRLPVVFDRAAELLLEEVRRHRPRVVIAVGLAGGRRAVTPERTAVNIQDARIPDNDGASPVDRPCVTGGPVGYFSTLPIKAMVFAATGEEQVPAGVSQSAGTYVCNDVFYRLQHALATEPELHGIRGGFVHVPAAEDLPIASTAVALERMVRCALSTEIDDHRPGGSES